MIAHFSRTAIKFDLLLKSIHCFVVTIGLIQTIIASIQALLLGRLVQSYNRFVLISPSNFRSSEVAKRCYNHWFIAIFKRTFPCNRRPFLFCQALFQKHQICKRVSSELFLRFFLQHLDNLNFQRKANHIDPFRD